MGKEVTFTSTHSISSSVDNTRDIGTAEINGLDISIELLKNGWAKLKESKREPTEEDLKKREAEAEAKNGEKGIWNPHGPQVRAEFLSGGGMVKTCCVQRSMLNFGVFVGQNGGIQHARRYTGIYGHLEGETDRW